MTELKSRKERLIELAQTEEAKRKASYLSHLPERSLEDPDLYARLAHLPEIKEAIKPYMPPRPAGYPDDFAARARKHCPDSEHIDFSMKEGVWSGVRSEIRFHAKDPEVSQKLLQDLKYIHAVLLCGYAYTRKLIIDDYLNETGPFAPK
jgi:hypothetical protein